MTTAKGREMDRAKGGRLVRIEGGRGGEGEKRRFTRYTFVLGMVPSLVGLSMQLGRTKSVR